MLSLTHRLIADEVFKSLKSELNIEIDKRWLQNGSVIPDFHPLLMFLPHTKAKSLKIVQENIEWLTERGISYDKKKDKKEFSYKLGIITHFVSDYFCKAHNDQKYDNLLVHYLYERKLKEYCSEHIKCYKQLEHTSKIKDWHLQGSIVEFIDEKHKEYSSIRNSMSDDMVYSIGISATVALNIVSAALERGSDHLEGPGKVHGLFPDRIIKLKISD